MQVKTEKLEGVALDYAVALCDGYGIDRKEPSDPWLTRDGIAEMPLHAFSPSTEWNQGGKRIEAARLTVAPSDQKSFAGQGAWSAYRLETLFTDKGDDEYQYGETLLVAAMRCYVASKLGTTVEIPDNL